MGGQDWWLSKVPLSSDVLLTDQTHLQHLFGELPALRLRQMGEGKPFLLTWWQETSENLLRWGFCQNVSFSVADSVYQHPCVLTPGLNRKQGNASMHTQRMWYPRMNPNRNYELWAIAGSPRSLVDCNKCSTPMRSVCVWRQRVDGISMLSAQFCCATKTSLENKGNNRYMF